MNSRPPAPQAGIMDQSRRPPHVYESVHPSEMDGAILKTLWANRHLTELRSIRIRLHTLSKAANLFEPLVVEKYILSQPFKANYRNKLLESYHKFTQVNSLEWTKPKRTREDESIIKIPTEQRIDLIISSSTRTYSTVFKLSKYGLRPLLL